MVAFRPLLVLSLAAGTAVAGKCRPSSSISASTETSLTTLATETSVTESSTESVTASTTETTTDTATETLSTETTTSLTIETSTTETTTSSTTDTTLTTLMTSLSSTETTTEVATTTSEAAVVVTCPSTTEQCLRTMKIQCDYILGGIPFATETDLNSCAHGCDQDPSCALFVFDQSLNYCYRASSPDSIEGEGPVPGWVSGVKGRCGQ